MDVENQENREKDEMLESYIADLQLEQADEEETSETVAETTTEETTEVAETKPDVVLEGNTGEVSPVGEGGLTGEATPEFLEPEFKSDKDRWIYEKIKAGEEKEVFEKLNEKYGFERLSPEEKMLSFLSAKYPHLDQEEIAFKAQDYGIGVEEVDEDLLSDAEKRELRKQAIDRKGLLSEADNFFKERQEAIELPSLANPLDADEGYKAYKEEIVQREIAQKEQEEYTLQINNDIDTTAKVLERVGVEVKMNLDDGEFALQVQFDLDDKKRTQLADFAKVYTPTQEQVEAHTDANGKFDMKGYMTDLANIRFAKQIMQAGIKQALVKDRETFETRELKNSTLNNREVNQQAPSEVDWYSAMMAK